jgi:hypothetical protein
MSTPADASYLEASNLDVSDFDVSPMAGPGEVSTLVLKLWRDLRGNAR